VLTMFTTISSNIGNLMNNMYFSEEGIFFQELQNFFSSTGRELLIFSPYIKTEVLEKLIKKCPSKISIITTWKLRDIQMGISDIELYTYCRKNGIFLYLHPRIHLKAFVNDYSQCVFGSANISRNGFALVADHNYELDAKVENLDIDTVIYFKKILN